VQQNKVLLYCTPYSCLKQSYIQFKKLKKKWKGNGAVERIKEKRDWPNEQSIIIKTHGTLLPWLQAVCVQLPSRQNKKHDDLVIVSSIVVKWHEVILF